MAGEQEESSLVAWAVTGPKRARPYTFMLDRTGILDKMNFGTTD